MSEISVYYPSQMPAEKVLTRVLEKILQQGERAVVFVDSDLRLSHLNTFLWTYHPSSFLPHGTVLEGDAGRQPIWLTTTVENPNGASVFIGMDGVPSSLQGEQEKENYEKYVFILPQGEEIPSTLELFLKNYQKKGFKIVSFQQNGTGGWESF